MRVSYRHADPGKYLDQIRPAGHLDGVVESRQVGLHGPGINFMPFLGRPFRDFLAALENIDNGGRPR